jgi:hypothetical protein
MHKTFALFTFIAAAGAAQACDICGTTLIRHPWDPRAGLTIGASEQFTRMKTLQQDGSEIDNDARQKLDSSITQIYLGYHITPRFGVQVNTPFIHRTFRRTIESGIENGSVSGIGDVSVAANWLAIDHRKDDFVCQVQLTAGFKFPTGDSDRLKEESAEGHHHGGEESEHAEEEPAPEVHHHFEGNQQGLAGRVPRHNGFDHDAEAGHSEGDHESEGDHSAEEGTELPVSGVHGHDLALGTGSFDGIFGASINLRWKRVFFTGEVQYVVRGDGDHDYDYANDFQWTAGPGFTLIDRESHTLSFQFICSGETKGEDEFRGRKADDTSITQVFIGPKFSGTWRDRFAAEFALDVPVHQYNSGVQVVPDYRIRASINWMF